jgi:integrase
LTNKKRCRHVSIRSKYFNHRTIPANRLQRFLAYSDGRLRADLFRSVLLVFANTGLRMREMRDLRWCDVDSERMAIRLLCPKSPTLTVIRLNDKAVVALECLRRLNPDSDFVLGPSHQTILWRVNFMIRSTAVAISSRPLSFHALRKHYLRQVLCRSVKLRGNPATPDAAEFGDGIE